MKTKMKMMVLTVVASMFAGISIAQSAQPSEPACVREPPPQAYTDCIGKKTGDIVQHTTREGKVAATCVDSPKGLVARPNRPRGNQSNTQPRQSTP
jgi:hypothetical protein